MTTFQQIKLGFTTYGKAIEFIFKNNLYLFFFVPVVLNLALFFGGYAFIRSLTEWITEWVIAGVGLQDADFFLSDFLGGFLMAIIWIILKLLFFLVFAYFGGYIILIFMSPVLAHLSEKTDSIITGTNYPFSADQLMRDVFRGITIALINMTIEFFFIIILFVLSFIPLLTWACPIALFLISSYFYGFSFMDYSSERNKLKIKDSMKFIWKNKWVSTTNGAVFSIGLLIPFCGVMLAGFSAIISVVAATMAVHEIGSEGEIIVVDDQKKIK